VGEEEETILTGTFDLDQVVIGVMLNSFNLENFIAYKLLRWQFGFVLFFSMLVE